MPEYHTKCQKKNAKKHQRQKLKKQQQRMEERLCANRTQVYVRDGRHSTSKCTGRTNMLSHQRNLAKIPITEAIQEKQVFSFHLPMDADLRLLQATIALKMGIPVCNQRLILGQRDLTGELYQGDLVIACLSIFARTSIPYLWVFDKNDHDNEQIEQMTSLLHWEAAAPMCSYAFPYGREFKDFDDWWEDTDPGPPTPCEECETNGHFNCKIHGERYYQANVGGPFAWADLE